MILQLVRGGGGGGGAGTVAVVVVSIHTVRHLGEESPESHAQ